jgi:lipopolysaccharide/colanic/teichoic acid biosynthesis glycosyltransferase
MNRFRDIIISLSILLLFSPLLLIVCVIVWTKDWHTPFYIADRVGKEGKLFSMVKLRSMIVNADSTGVDSTGKNDDRITPIGHFIRRYKLDEITQMWNVLIGDMSLVGPRPNVRRETDLYSDQEIELLSVKPGVTDFSSIIFSDEAEILADYENPDLAYNQLIRPWKSRLGILYVRNMSFFADIKLIFLTAITIIDRPKGIKYTVKLLKDIDCPDELLEICKRDKDLYPYPPPGFSEIVSQR